MRIARSNVAYTPTCARYETDDAVEQDCSLPDESLYWRAGAAYTPTSLRGLPRRGSPVDFPEKLGMPYRLGPCDLNSDSHYLLDKIDGLYRYALRLTGSQDDAEDLIQEMYLRALSAVTRLQNHDNIHGWLFTILRNLCLNHLRSAGRMTYICYRDIDQTDLPALRETDRDPHLLFAQRVEREQVRRAIALLPPVNQETLLLREYEGLSYQQIAHMLQCPLGTVMSRLARARSKLRTILLEWHVEIFRTDKAKTTTASEIS